MKTKLLLFITFAFLLLTGCKSNQEKELTEAEAKELLSTKMQEAPVKIATESEMPEWLNTNIKELEPTIDTILFKLVVFKGVWNQKNIYLIDEPGSCPLCKVYIENGTKIEWNDSNNVNDFILNSKNWILIYKYGSGTSMWW